MPYLENQEGAISRIPATQVEEGDHLVNLGEVRSGAEYANCMVITVTNADHTIALVYSKHDTLHILKK